MIDDIEKQSCLLMLPELSNDKIHYYPGRKELYYCIVSNWCEINRKNTLIIPKSHCCDYR